MCRRCKSPPKNIVRRIKPIIVNGELIDTDCRAMHTRNRLIYKIKENESMKPNSITLTFKNAIKTITENINGVLAPFLLKHNDDINSIAPSYIDWKHHCAVYIEGDMEIIHITDILTYKDGDTYFVHWMDFLNLQESIHGFWRTKKQAIEYYIMKRMKRQHIIVKQYE